MNATLANRLQKDRGVAPALLRRIKDMVAAKLLGSEYGSPIGLMKLAGELTEREYKACNYYRELCAAYEASISAPHVKSPAIGGGSRGAPLDPFSDKGEAQARHQRRVMDRWHSVALVAIQRGRHAVAAFERTVIHDMAPSYPEKVEVVAIARLIWGACLDGRERRR